MAIDWLFPNLATATLCHEHKVATLRPVIQKRAGTTTERLISNNYGNSNNRRNTDANRTHSKGTINHTINLCITSFRLLRTSTMPSCSDWPARRTDCFAGLRRVRDARPHTRLPTRRAAILLV